MSVSSSKAELDMERATTTSTIRLSKMQSENKSDTSSPLLFRKNGSDVKCDPKWNFKGASNFKIRRKLGDGAVGEVFLVIHNQSKQLYALKRIEKTKAQIVSTLTDADVYM